MRWGSLSFGLLFALVLLVTAGRGVSSSADFGTYLIHRPAGLSHARAVPLVLACCGRAMETDTTLDQQSNANGFVVAYLIPSKTYNDDARHRGPGPPYPDTQWISSVIDQLIKAENVDQRRVFMTGVSSGGTLSYRIACDFATKVAGIASVSGSDVVPGCRPSRPISVLEVHGTGDPAIPYNGNALLESVPQINAKWRKIDNCSGAVQTKTTTGVRDETWSNCDAGTAVELVTIIGGDHGWQRSPTFDTGGAVSRFFAAHPMASQAALTARLTKASVQYGSRRQVVVRLSINQASRVQVTLVKGSRSIARRTFTVGAGPSVVVRLAVPRTAKPGRYTLRITVGTGADRVALVKKIELRR
jgi:polyhydroxybutyrate depolymerase